MNAEKKYVFDCSTVLILLYSTAIGHGVIKDKGSSASTIQMDPYHILHQMILPLRYHCNHIA